MSEHTLALTDGRTLGYAEFGAQAGKPVFYCHGLPGSRLEAALASTTAESLGLRIVAPDRPGFGRSSLHDARRLSDWPDDLAQLADHLGIDRLNILGVSGGGPYAVACAERLPGRVEQLVLVCPLAPLAATAATSGMTMALAALVRSARTLPPLAHVYGLGLTAISRRWPALVVEAMARQAPPSDQTVLRDAATRAIIAASVHEAFRQGGRGPAQELALHLRPWDIDPGRVKVRTELWQGEADTTVPPTMARWYARRLPSCELHSVPGEGHFSLPVRHMTSILSAFTRR